MSEPLRAWDVWAEAQKAYNKLDSNDSPGAEPDWKIYWISGVVLLRTIGHVLHKVDARKSTLHGSIVSDFWQELNLNRVPIFWDFIEVERNNVLKTFETGTSISRTTILPWQDRHLTYSERAAKYGETIDIDWNGEEGLRLYAIALRWWEEKLRMVDEAVESTIAAPFSMKSSDQNRLLQTSYSKLGPLTVSKRW